MQQAINKAYLQENRIQNVIAAIQAMSTNEKYMQKPSGWALVIGGAKENASIWEQVFKEHGEFFRFDITREKVSLVLRSQKNSLAVETDEGQRTGREPLSEAQMLALIDVAIRLHTNAIQLHQAKNWWAPIALTSILTTFVTLIASHFPEILKVLGEWFH